MFVEVKFKGLLASIFFTAILATAASAQPPDPWFPDRDRRREEEAKIVKDMLAKQQSEHEKKEYQELLARGDEALAISTALEKAFDKNDKLTGDDQKRLAELEKLVVKIRDDLGGDDDVDEESDSKDPKPKDLREGFLQLKESTEKLVSELKKTTRYSVSIMAIESSNSLIKLVRFLRFSN